MDSQNAIKVGQEPGSTEGNREHENGRSDPGIGVGDDAVRSRDIKSVDAPTKKVNENKGDREHENERSDPTSTLRMTPPEVTSMGTHTRRSRQRNEGQNKRVCICGWFLSTPTSDAQRTAHLRCAKSRQHFLLQSALQPCHFSLSGQRFRERRESESKPQELDVSSEFGRNQGLPACPHGLLRAFTLPCVRVYGSFVKRPHQLLPILFVQRK